MAPTQTEPTADEERRGPDAQERGDGDGGGARGANRREVAHRVFAAEFNASTVEIKSTEERAPSFVLTPLGAKVNRLFFVGVLTSTEKVNEEMWRARVSDPSGVFTLYSGQFTPEASQALASIEVPSYVAVVGKARTYEPEPGRVFVSVRPESIRVVDEAARNRWVLETARRTRLRLDALREARQREEPTAEDLAKVGFPVLFAEGAALAAVRYGATELEPYEDIVSEALRHLLESMGEGLAAQAARPPRGAAPPPAAAATAPPPPPVEEGDPEAEAAVLEAVKELEKSDAKGAPWDDVVARGQAAKIDAQRVEEALNALMDKGVVYEPILGRLRSA